MADWNHVISVNMNKANNTLWLIPDTRSTDILLSHPNCPTCKTLHGTKWAPDSKKPVEKQLTTKNFDFFYMMQSY